MDKWFESKWFIRMISLAFAILLYTVVNFEEATTHQDARIPGGIDTDRIQTLHDVPVNIKIDSERYVVSGAQEFISVSFEGPNSILIPTVMQRNFEFYIDLRDLEEGTHTVDVQYSNVPKELKVYIEPKTLEITLEERVSEEFYVEVDYINLNQLPQGYEISEPEINPEVVTITSSRSIFEQISMVKAYIDVSGLTESINNREVPINVYDSQGNVLSVRIEPDTVVISADVDNPSKVVPIEVPTVNELPDYITDYSITLQVEEVEVFAVSRILEDIESIQTEEIDLQNLEKSGEMELALETPEDVIVDLDSVIVDIEIEVEEVFEEIPIEYENLTTDLEIAFITPNEPFMRMTVTGNDQDVNAITLEDLRLSLDVDGLDIGEHIVPVTVEGEGLDDVKISLEHEEVRIRIVRDPS